MRLERVYRQACARRRWWIVRYCAAKLRKVTNLLASGVTSILVRGKQVRGFFVLCKCDEMFFWGTVTYYGS